MELKQCSSIPSSAVVFLEFWCCDFQLLAQVTRRKLAIDSLRAGRSRDRISVEARFYAAVQTGPEAHPSLLYDGYRSITRVKRPGGGVDHPPHTAPRLKKE